MSHFGDLLGGDWASGAGAVQDDEGGPRGSPFLGRAGRPLASRLSPLGRLVVTANGNLQRVVSSWTNLAVSVVVLRNERLGKGGAEAGRAVEAAVGAPARVEPLRFARRVHLECGSRCFAVAESVVTLRSAELIAAVSSGAVGIGQLFRQFDLLPAFELRRVALVAGRALPLSVGAAVVAAASPPAAGELIERDYSLRAWGIECDISEWIDLSQLPVPPPPPAGEPLEHRQQQQQQQQQEQQREQQQPQLGLDPPAAGHFGDVMSGTRTVVTLSDAWMTPLERVLSTANGNVQRVLSSALNCPVRVVVEEPGRVVGERDGSRMLERAVRIVGPGGVTLCEARSEVSVRGAALERLAASEVEVGALFGRPGERGATLPRFTLESVRRCAQGGLERSYQLAAPAACVRVSERFSPAVFEQ
jgi:hypothetical protein